MQSGKDKTVLVKLFYMNEESENVALLKFRLQENVKTGKGHLTVAGLIKLVQRFEETGSCKILTIKSKADTFGEIETLESESAVGTSRAREAGRRLGLPPSSIRNILMEFLISIHTDYSLSMNFYHRIP
ncbi:hypothetical protein NPIL_192681 [Nephila pilipes]|uniref:Cyclic nucleotide-binding domain-containing protein n=1 Tax=Nephila pilipes TaxID=299642 RepID=A0A8X6TZ87_NEPPI|nr:hypothetical protein NPIL_192681 [Nephila pilipes]